MSDVQSNTATPDAVVMIFVKLILHATKNDHIEILSNEAEIHIKTSLVFMMNYYCYW